MDSSIPSTFLLHTPSNQKIISKTVFLFIDKYQKIYHQLRYFAQLIELDPLIIPKLLYTS